MTSSKRTKTEYHRDEVCYAFKVHSILHDPYEPLKLELWSDTRIKVTQGGNTTELHGHWNLDDAGLLTTLWHYQGNIYKAKLQHYVRIPHTDAYESINCDSAWRSILIPWKD
jgi:hypothetical protein